jgi:hypothetical protein
MSVAYKTWIQNRVILRAAAFWRTEGSVRARILKQRLSENGPSLLLYRCGPVDGRSETPLPVSTVNSIKL